MIIRETTPDDWDRIFPIFSTIVAAGRTYAYPEGLSVDDARALWMEQPPGRTVVAVVDDEILGSAKMGPNRPGRGSHIATASFMVDPKHAGKGVGRALGEEALRWAHSAGYHGMQFNAVVASNTAAIRLWQSLGFRILATVPEAFDDREEGLVGLHVMFRSLTASRTRVSDGGGRISRMTVTTITTDSTLMTLINVFTVDPDRQQELVDLLIEATDTVMRHLPGFVSANIHRSHDGVQVVNYAQWRSRADFDAMLQNPEAGAHMAQAVKIARFNPIICDVADTCHA